MTAERKNPRPPGLVNQVIFNRGGRSVGDSDLTFDGTTLTCAQIVTTTLTTVSGQTISGGLTVSGLTVQDNATVSGTATITSGVLNTLNASGKVGFYGATPSTQPAAIGNITVTATAGSLPTPNGSVTIADASTPTVVELLEYCVELEAKLETTLATLRTLGLIAT